MCTTHTQTSQLFPMWSESHFVLICIYSHSVALSLSRALSLSPVLSLPASLSLAPPLHLPPSDIPNSLPQYFSHSLPPSFSLPPSLSPTPSLSCPWVLSLFT